MGRFRQKDNDLVASAEQAQDGRVLFSAAFGLNAGGAHSVMHCYLLPDPELLAFDLRAFIPRDFPPLTVLLHHDGFVGEVQDWAGDLVGFRLWSGFEGGAQKSYCTR
jgi:hypothetical protein